MAFTRLELLPIKSHYLFFYAGIAPIVLFMPTYAKQLGFSSVLVGSIYTILPMVGMLSKPIMGAIADRFHIHKILVVCLLSCAAASWFSLMYIPPVEGNIKGTIECDANGASHLHMCTEEKELDKCLSFKIMSEKRDKEAITCKMTCYGDDNFRQEVCDSWHMDHYCHKRDKTIINENTILCKSDNSTVPQPMHFDAEFCAKDLTTTNDKCLALPFGGVKDAEIPDSQLRPAVCKTHQMANCTMTCNSETLSKEGKEKGVSLMHFQFWMFISLMIIGWVGMASVTNIGDTICFSLLTDVDGDYGNQRLWGSIGWGVVSMMSGLLMDKFSESKTDKNYSPLFYMVAVLLGMDAIVSSRFKKVQQAEAKNFIGDIGNLLMNFKVIIFMFWCILAGTFNGLIGNFLFWHLENLASCEDQHWIKTLEGLYIFIQSFGGEMPFFFLNGWLLRTIGNHNCMSLVLLAFAFKFLFYSILENPWYCLPIGLLNGITFSTFYATMTSHAASIAAPGTEATVQGLVGAVYEGVGVSLGSFLAGVLMYYFEGTFVFKVYGVVALTMCLMHTCLVYFTTRAENIGSIDTTKDKDPFADPRTEARYASPNYAIDMVHKEDNTPC